MSVAQSVTEFEPINVNWLKVEDDAGSVWRYVKRRQVNGSLPHVAVEIFAPPTPARILIAPEFRQDEPGLPLTIVAKIIEGRAAGMPMQTMWPAEFEFEQEQQ